MSNEKQDSKPKSLTKKELENEISDKIDKLEKKIKSAARVAFITLKSGNATYSEVFEEFFKELMK